MFDYNIGILGLGYVGLPLAIEFANKYNLVGYDKSKERIVGLRKGFDSTLEVTKEELTKTSMKFSDDPQDLKNCNVYIVTVPTPITSFKQPDLAPLVGACETVAGNLNEGDIVIFESTVFPGCTEEVCVPLLESGSGLKYNVDFYCGYSPERINPGDKKRGLKDIVKVTSGSTKEVAIIIDNLYNSIISAGTYLTSSIKVAEAAKVIENSQRDINIAFANELSMIFNRLEIDTLEVLEAAGSKWNFLPFRPGLVGGHCIGVDPYYLTHKAESMGYHAEVILAGRKINDNMGKYVASQVVKLMIKRGLNIKDSKVLVLGVTFKENCPDIRNSKVFDMIDELEEFGSTVSIFDPWADDVELGRLFKRTLSPKKVLDNLGDFQAIIFAVAHEEFKDISMDSSLDDVVIYDLKGIFPKGFSDGRL